MFRLLAQSPAVLQGYLSLSGALSKALDLKTRERIALAVAQANGCDYCLSAHSYLGLNLAKISADEIALNRKGGSGDAKADAAIRFAVKVTEARGKVATADIDAVRAAGFTEPQILEIIGMVAENFLTNLFNNVAETDIDFRPSTPPTQPELMAPARLTGRCRSPITRGADAPSPSGGAPPPRALSRCLRGRDNPKREQMTLPETASGDYRRRSPPQPVDPAGVIISPAGPISGNGDHDGQSHAAARACPDERALHPGRAGEADGGDGNAGDAGQAGRSGADVSLAGCGRHRVGRRLALLFGLATRPVAAVLGVWCIITALTAHTNFADQNTQIHFMKNLAMAGGFIYVAIFGAGTLSIDGWRARRSV
ncbi:MAG: carboxymuconolactone decarboxylase family protein [Aliidongia sp.]